MTRSELQEMTDLAERLLAAGEPGVLATLYESSGSTYRPLGSMMVSGPGSMLAGGVSGGCLEEYVARQGRLLVARGEPAMLSFDADPDAGDGAAPVLGCGGSIQVLVERLTADHLHFLRRFTAAHNADEPSAAACLIDMTSAPASMIVRRTWLDSRGGVAPEAALRSLRRRTLFHRRSRCFVIGPSRRCLVHYIAPLTRLVIFGAGDDVRPVCALARSLGWHVTVADRRARLATPPRFGDADAVIAADWATAVERILFTSRTAVVLMTHSLADDIEILPLLQDRPAAYLGILGPAHRRQWVFDGVAPEAALADEFVERVRGPVGLNLGDRSAGGIAVSLISQIMADLNHCAPTPLSVPIDRTAIDTCSVGVVENHV